MHDTAFSFANLFLDTYLGQEPKTVIEVGSQDINGSLRRAVPAPHSYIGLDLVPGKNVDVVMTDPYKIPLEDNSVDVCIASSCMEHAEFFWLSFLEMLRILKPSGILYLNSPSNGAFHRRPTDCWRFYPDSGAALQNWANRNGYDSLLLETFTGVQRGDIWNDWIAVFAKSSQFAAAHPRRMLHSVDRYTNGMIAGDSGFRNFSRLPEDQRRPKPRVYRSYLERKRWYLGAISKRLARRRPAAERTA